MNLSPKVNQNRISEKEYRNLRDRLSYSYLKLFDQDRESFFKQLILGEKKIEKQTPSIVMGQLVHTLLSQEDFDVKFHISQTSKPVGQMGELCDALYTRSMQSLNEFNEQQDNFKMIFSDAVRRVKYDFNGEEIAFKKKDEAKILEMFEGTNAELYYKEQTIDAFGKIIVSIPQIEQAERLVQKIKENSVTERYVNQQTEWLDEVRDIKAIEIYNELPILFNYMEIPCKILPDKLKIDHVNKTIEPIDWKCSSWDNESPEGSYLKYAYYIQAALYDTGIEY